MSTEPAILLTAEMVATIDRVSFVDAGADKDFSVGDVFLAIQEIGDGRVVCIATAELEMFKQCRRLLYGFMLDANSIGLTCAAENLARGIKEQAIAQEKANG